MNKLNILRRHLTVLRLVQPPFSYPSKSRILERLCEESLDSASARTFERDKKEVEDFYGIKITYSPRHRGYYLDQPEDEDLSSFRQFFQLLERSERLAFLTHSTDALSTSRYLLLEENQTQDGLQHLPLLWEALRAQRQVAFLYQTFKNTVPKAYNVDPLVLLEYRNRWYLAAWDPKVQRFKTYGLERIHEPQLTQVPVRVNRREEFLALKRDALGVFIGPDHEVARVVLRVNTEMAPYIKTAPIHHSQTTLAEDETGLTIALQIIVCKELESLLLSYGEHLEVLEPVELRERVKERVKNIEKNYANSNRL